MAVSCFEDEFNGGWWCDGCGPNGDLWHHWVGEPQTQAGADASCENAFTSPGGQPYDLAPMNLIRERGVDYSKKYPVFKGGKGNPKGARKKMQFGGVNRVPQRPIGVSPSQGGFFGVPRDERNFGQQSSLPYEQQLNMNHKSNFSHCGHSNFVHSNFAHNNFAHNNFAHSNFASGGNTDAIFSGGMSNVGPQDRIYAGNYANGRLKR